MILAVIILRNYINGKLNNKNQTLVLESGLA